ncbi:MAG: M1 family metallopeptidase [Christensenellaceae bacterium]|nr:M1 family metallopeptidase [Christensenellaceae bacterium]
MTKMIQAVIINIKVITNTLRDIPMGMKHGKKILGFFAIASCIVGLVVVTLVLLKDDTLKRAAAGCDTINITATYDDTEKTLKTEQSMSYKNRTGQAISEIKFHIYANAYKDGVKNPPVEDRDITNAYPSGKSFGGITIHNVSQSYIIDGDDDTVLVVQLGEPLESGKSVKLDMNYTVKLANVKHRLGWTDDAVNLANFYPVPCIFENGAWLTYPYSSNGDPFFNAMHNFNVKLTAPSDMVVASSGSLVRDTRKSNSRDTTATTSYQSSAIRDFAMVLSTKFKVATKTVGKTAVKYYYLDDAEPQKSLDTACSAMTTFSELFTKYPYNQLSVVQTDFLHGGMEYGELVYVSRALLPTDRANHEYVIVHEIAHQWWYGMVGNNQSRTAWIDEGLAEYSTMLFFDRHKQYNVERDVLIENARKNYAAYIKIVQGVGGELDTNMNRELDQFNTSYEYVYMTYVRGLLLFCDLEKIISVDNLLLCLKNFSTETKFGVATQEKLVQSIEATTNAKVKLFFDTYTGGWSGFQK